VKRLIPKSLEERFLSELRAAGTFMSISEKAISSTRAVSFGRCISSQRVILSSSEAADPCGPRDVPR
jgi:hypothetical protein